MMADERRYTANQIATASRELTEAAGAPEQEYTAEEAIAMLDREILLLRERGFTDERIAGLFSGFDIEVTPGQIGRHAPPSL
jgi:hypothetical protein